MIRTDSTGKGIWQCRNNGGREGRSVRQTQDGGFIVAGYTSTQGAGGKDFYMFKLKSNYVCGDANGSGLVEIGDVTRLQNYLYL